jgi:ABC-type uncharacterized transport system substrate-binding protein
LATRKAIRLHSLGFAAFQDALAKLGWREGGNLRIELRWGAGDADRIGTLAKELVDMRPHAIFGVTTPVIGALARETRTIARSGGLITYGDDYAEGCRLAAGYIDRILKGAKPEELPIQLPTKFQLVINLKTAKALGLDVPWQLQQLADEVIE